VIFGQLSTRQCPLFPYTTLFRSPGAGRGPAIAGDGPRDRADDPRRARRGRLPEHPAVERALGLMCGAGTLPARMAAEAQRQGWRSEEHTSELQSLRHLVCRLLLE